MLTFPDGFLWGAATAAHQIEGNNVNSNWWVHEHAPGTTIVEPSGDAADSTAAVVAAHVPVLVAHGDADDVWPIADQYDMAVRLGAEYRVIPDAGHLPNIDNPAVTARFLSEFWAEF